MTQRLITTTTKGSKTKFVTSIANKSMVENYIQCSSFITSCSHSNLHNDSPINEQQKQTKPAKTNTTDDTKISVTFTRPDGTKVTVESSQDKTLYDAVIDNNVDIDGFGACEGTLCCTTCHLILKPEDFEKIGGPNDEELDMLDLAYGLTDTSRLGCQVTLKKEFDPLEVQVPASINDVREC